MRYADDNYQTIDTEVTGQTRVVDLTKPGQLTTISTESDQTAAIMQVFSCLPANIRTQEAIEALTQCFFEDLFDFADIARRHQVPSLDITVSNNQHYELTHQQDTYYQPQFQPSFTPHYQPSIEFRPVINIDAHSLAHSQSHQDSSGDGGNRFWILVFAVIGIFAVSGVVGGGK